MNSLLQLALYLHSLRAIVEPGAKTSIIRPINSPLKE